jgi:GTPase SAR1 family protein
MIFLLIIAGISISANAVSWWNGRRTEAVEREILGLERQLEAIRAADQAQRRMLIGDYLDVLERCVDLELGTRAAILKELQNCKLKADQVLRQRFGPREADSFIQMHLELDVAVHRLEAEQHYFTQLKATFPALRQGRGDQLPTPGALTLPPDFPSEGTLIQFEDAPPAFLHGYRLQALEDAPAPGERVLFARVNHDLRTAKLSATSATLLEASAMAGSDGLLATVTSRDEEGAHLELGEAVLLLPARRGSNLGWLIPGAELRVYPEAWSLKEIMGQGQNAPLAVRLHPRIEENRKQWTPISLYVEEAQLPQLVAACERFEAQEGQDRPWHVQIETAGEGAEVLHGTVVFSLAGIHLRTRPDPARGVFVFIGASDTAPEPGPIVRLHAELQVQVAGTGDEQEADPSLFLPFLTALHSELALKRSRHAHLNTALKYRKLSTIYQDQLEFLQTSAVCGFLLLKAEKLGRVLTGVVLDAVIPPWLRDALADPTPGRIRLVGPDRIWGVRSGTVLAKGQLRFELAVASGATFQDIDPSQLNRIELVGEGSQQQVLSQALEKAISGQFASRSVHETLMGNGEPSVPNTRFGREAAAELLASEAPVVAIWGPPGTGKTTLLVQWLLSLFRDRSPADYPRILITAPTHVAVDNLLKGILKERPELTTEMVRYSAFEDRVDSAILPHVHTSILAGLHGEGTPELQERWKRVLCAKTGREAFATWALGGRHLHAATCAGMAKRDYGLNRKPFDVVIVDEAGKAFLAEILLPASVARKLILVGDHNQLPPTVTEDMLAKVIGYRLPLAEVEEMLRRNTFQDFFEELPGENKAMLTEQHRMHKDLGDLVGALFYGGRLTSAKQTSQFPMVSKRLQVVDFSGHLRYLHVVDEFGSLANGFEREILLGLLDHLRSRGVPANLRILVICPYKAQREALQAELKQRDYPFPVTASTVDAVQGGQATLVFLLMTRGAGQSPFLLDRNRLNVALSRAEEAIIILGCLEVLTRGGAGPVAQLVDLGQKAGTLSVHKLGRHRNAPGHLAAALFPASPQRAAGPASGPTPSEDAKL